MFEAKIEQKITKVIKKTIKSESFFGFNVKKLRTEKNISQEVLAEKLNISRPSVSNIELGRHRVGIDMLKKLCEILECESKDLLGF